MIGKQDADREAWAPDSGHIYRELDRDMEHGTRATRQRRLRQQTRELIGYILQPTSGATSSANIGLLESQNNNNSDNGNNQKRVRVSDDTDRIQRRARRAEAGGHAQISYA